MNIDQIHSLNQAFAEVELKLTEEIERLKQRESDIYSKLQEERTSHELEKANLLHVNEEQNKFWMRDQVNLDQKFTKNLQEMHDERDHLQLELQQCQDLLFERNKQIEQILESHEQLQSQQSNDFALQIATLQQVYEKEKSELQNLMNQTAGSKQQLSEQLQILKDDFDRKLQDLSQRENILKEEANHARYELDGLLRTMVTRERDVGIQLLAVQQEATKKLIEHSQQYFEQIESLHSRYAERELTLNKKLYFLEQELTRIQKENTEQIKCSRDILSSQLSMQFQREQEILAIIESQQKRFDQQRDELIYSHSLHEHEMRINYAECEQGFNQEREVLKEQFQKNEQAWKLQEEVLINEVNNLRDSVQICRQREDELRARYFDIEQVLIQERDALSKQLCEDEQAWKIQEIAFANQIHSLQSYIQELNHSKQSQEQLHNIELNSNIEQHVASMAASKALETQLQAEILLERKSVSELSQTLAEMKKNLAFIHSSLIWRLTTPIRKLASFISPKSDQ